MTGQEKTGTKWNTGSFIWMWEDTLLLWGWLSTATGYPESLWSLMLWRYWKNTWTCSCATCFLCTCFSSAVGWGDPQRSLPVTTILWFPHLTLHKKTGTAQKGFFFFQDEATAWETMGWKQCTTSEAGQASQAQLLLQWRQCPATRSRQNGGWKSISEEAVFLRSVLTVHLGPSVLVCKKVWGWWDHISPSFPHNSWFIQNKNSDYENRKPGRFNVTFLESTDHTVSREDSYK